MARNITYTPGGMALPQQEYLQVRKTLLETTPDDLKIAVPEPEEKVIVYGAIVDMKMEDRIVTLSCFIDGSASLLYSVGGGVLGLGQKFPNVRKASGTFVLNAMQAIPSCRKPKSLDLPSGSKHYIYLLTNEGIAFTMIDIMKLEDENKQRQFLFTLYKRVLDEIQLVSPKLNSSSQAE